MVIADESVPTDIVDRLLWLDAQQMLGRHAGPGDDDNCVWCGWRWPCAPRRLAERAEVAARRPWREAWTVRHDLNSIRGLRAGFEENAGRHAAGQRSTNRGYF
jgi:hypothetical protein